MSSRGPVLLTGHDLSEEAEVAGVVILVRVGDALFTDGAQGPVGPDPEVLEHGAMHVLQRLPLKHFLSVLPRDGLGIGNPLLKRKQLGAGGGQLCLPQD